LFVEASMRPVPIVVMQPGVEVKFSFQRGGVGASISPLANSGLDEALGLAVGAWRVGPGAAMGDALL